MPSEHKLILKKKIDLKFWNSWNPNKSKKELEKAKTEKRFEIFSIQCRNMCKMQ